MKSTDVKWVNCEWKNDVKVYECVKNAVKWKIIMKISKEKTKIKHQKCC